VIKKKFPHRLVPTWDDYYMALTYIIASRSKDPSTQVGAIIVNKDNRPLGIGYNGTPQSIPDREINWERPDKYVFIDHAEINAMDHAEIGYNTLNDCTIYVSGMPCPNCTRRIIAKKIKRVVYGKTPIKMLDENTIKDTSELIRVSSIYFECYQGNINWLRDRMDWLENNLPEIFL